MRLTVISHPTLDGVMQSNGKPEPELNDGFEQGGWQVPYFDDDMDRLTADWIAAADAPAPARQRTPGPWQRGTHKDAHEARRRVAVRRFGACERFS
jgi:hypothetical protein